MNRIFLIGLLALVCLSLNVNECYSCTPPPAIYIYDTPQYEPLSAFDDSYKLSIYAYCEENGPIEDWEWEWSPTAGVYDTNPDDWDDSDEQSVLECKFSSTGQYIFEAWGRNSEEWDWDTCIVYIIDVEIDTPSSFPAYVALGDDLALGCTASGAAGGTYSWTKVSGPGTVTLSPSASAEDPAFSANQAGNYTVKVEYTKGGATASDSSGTISVIDVEIDTPSSFPAYVGLGDNLSLGSTLTPSSASGGTYTWSKVSGPGTVTFSPSASDPDPSFSANQAGDYTVKVQYTKGGATVSDTSGTITVVEVDKIKIEYATDTWDDVTGDTIVLLKGTKYTFKAFPNPSAANWPSGTPNWSGVASGTGETIDVTLSSAGTQTLTAKCGSGDAGKSVTIEVVGLAPDQVSFVDYSADEEHDIDGITDPVWKRVSNPDNPCSYTKDKHVKTEAKFWASQDLTYSTVVDVNVEGSGSFSFAEDTGVTLQSWPSGTTSHSSNGKLTNSIGSTALTLTWKCKPSGTSTWITMASSSGPHTIYRVFDAPECGSSNYTEDNIDDAILQASGETDESDIASEANDNVDSTLDVNCICQDGFQKNFDAAMGSYGPGDKGMCCCRAEGLNCVLQVLGIGPYTHVWVNERNEPGDSSQYPGSCPTCGTVYRAYWAAGIWNNWEGAVRARAAGTTCYAPGGLSGGYDEGTYSGFQTKLATDYGFFWVKSPYTSQTDKCTHLPAP